MHIKERLKNYSMLCKEIKQIEQEIGQLEYSLRKMDIALMPVKPLTGAEIKNVQDKLLNLGEKYVEKLEAMYEERLELERYISRLDECMERIILRYRYIDLFQWQAITGKVGYEQAQVYRIHNRAMDKLDKLCA